MNDEDLKRELKKVLEAVSLAADYHTKINEANSKLHASDTVLHSPMTTKLVLAKQSLERFLYEGVCERCKGSRMEQDSVSACVLCRGTGMAISGEREE